MLKNNLKIYTLTNCLQCREIKYQLDKISQIYKEVIIDKNEENNQIGIKLEIKYKTLTYPILELYNSVGILQLSLITKTNLEEQPKIYIFDTINELINKIKYYEV